MIIPSPSVGVYSKIYNWVWPLEWAESTIQSNIGLHVYTMQQAFMYCLFEVTNTLLCSPYVVGILSVTAIHITPGISYFLCFAYKQASVATT